MNLESYFEEKVNKYFYIDLYVETWAIFASEMGNLVPVQLLRKFCLYLF